MKTLRFIGMALLAVVLSMNFAACSDDEEKAPFPNSIAGTEWAGTDSYDYIIDVVFGTSTCKIKVQEPDGSDYYDSTSSYTYDPSTGWITAKYKNTQVNGQVKGNIMTFDYDDDAIKLKKK